MLRINEIFNTIQCEGKYTGTPSTFIRLQGCKVGCGWCDTKDSWNTGTRLYSPEYIAELATLEHVVITGGEPCEQDLSELTAALSGKFRTLETSGTAEISGDFEWVTVSPKIGMPGGLVVLDSAILRADEIKFPVGKASDIDALKSLLSRAKEGVIISLQPLSQSKAATELCIKHCIANGWNLSIQVHKYIEIP